MLCSRRPQAPSQWSEGAEHLLERALEAAGRKVNPEGLCAPKKYPERERERERKQAMGTKALMEQRCFNQHGVGICTVVILSKDKD